MRLVPIESVRADCFLAKTIYDNDGRILLAEGSVLTSSLIKRIKSLQIYSIYIVDEYSDKEIEDVISPELRQKSIQLVKDIFKNSKTITLGSIDIFALNSRRRLEILQEKENYLCSLKDLSEEICHNILINKHISIGLVDIKNMDNYTYQHSVNVATLSVVLGVALGLSKTKLIDLCIGALLHDIGKVFVGKEIIQKPGALTDEEFAIIKTHPKLGYEYIKSYGDLKTHCKMIVLQHHERIDGSGYPNGLVKDDINLLARIVSIADVYDALTSDRPYKRAMCPNDAFEFILSKAGTMFDFELTKIFSRIMVPYPDGTIVELSNGCIARVEATHPLYPLRPTVKVIKSPNDCLNDKFIDLSKALSIVISSIIYEL